MDCKKCIMCTLLGGMAVYGYLKYKDGTLERTMKNIKPKIESNRRSKKIAKGNPKRISSLFYK